MADALSTQKMVLHTHTSQCSDCSVERGKMVNIHRFVTMNVFQKESFLFKSFVKIELSYVFTINMLSTAENCMEK